MQFNFNLEEIKIYSYATYRQLVDDLIANGKTTGTDHSEAMINYTKMNIVRMNRWDKTAKLSDKLSDLLLNAPKQKWLVLSEAWCGDAAQNLPIINKMAEQSTTISLEVMLRDENLDIMDNFLTNGGRAVPKLIALDEHNDILFTWGPRPKKMQEAVLTIKKEGGNYAEVVHKMYAQDRAASLQEEFAGLLSEILV